MRILATMFELDRSCDDETTFTDRVGTLIAGAAESDGIESIYVIKIDHWFGRKWLGFSYKYMGLAGVHHTGGPNPTLPPFKPSRVISERFYEREPQASWRRTDASGPLHLDQPSSRNQHRRIHSMFPATAFFWWSGQSQSSSKGSLMAYLPGDQEHFGWYVESAGDGGWRDIDLLCITASELDSIASSDTSGRI